MPRPMCHQPTCRGDPHEIWIWGDQFANGWLAIAAGTTNPGAGRLDGSEGRRQHWKKMKKKTWWVVSTHLKNISQIGSFPQVGVKIKNVWNHHLGPRKGHQKQTPKTKLLLIVLLNLDEHQWHEMRWYSWCCANRKCVGHKLHEICSLKDIFRNIASQNQKKIVSSLKFFDDLGTTLSFILCWQMIGLPPKYQSGSSEVINPADVGKINAQAISNLGEDSRELVASLFRNARRYMITIL